MMPQKPNEYSYVETERLEKFMIYSLGFIALGAAAGVYFLTENNKTNRLLQQIVEQVLAGYKDQGIKIIYMADRLEPLKLWVPIFRTILNIVLSCASQSKKQYFLRAAFTGMRVLNFTSPQTFMIENFFSAKTIIGTPFNGNAEFTFLLPTTSCTGCRTQEAHLTAAVKKMVDCAKHCFDGATWQGWTYQHSFSGYFGSGLSKVSTTLTAPNFQDSQCTILPILQQVVSANSKTYLKIDLVKS